MKIILTEDTGIGYEFTKLMAKALFGNNALVINSGYGGGSNATGGNSNIDLALDRFLEANRVDVRNDQVYILYDDFSLDPNISKSDKAKLANKISKCENTLDNMGITYKVRPCTCFEEVILSFKLLGSVCDPLGKNKNSREWDKIRDIQRKIWGTQSNSLGMTHLYSRDYSKILKGLVGTGYKSNTSEGRIKELLDQYMVRAEFSSLQIKPKSQDIGACWKLDCGISGGKECSVCRAKSIQFNGKRLRTARDRLLLVYAHSLYYEILK